MRIERSARLFALLCLSIVGSLVAPAHARAAEACTGAPSAFLVLDPGDDDSGIGGTGRSPTPAPRVRSGDDDDSGTGGTGQAPGRPDDGDSGIGGTGIFGTVSRGDRLCVNGFPIEVPQTLTLEASTGASSENRLAAGQVVFVHATRSEDTLVAQRIVLLDDHAGQVEVFAPAERQLIVSGRRVRLAEGLEWGDGLGLDTR